MELRVDICALLNQIGVGGWPGGELGLTVFMGRREKGGRGAGAGVEVENKQLWGWSSGLNHHMKHQDIHMGAEMTKMSCTISAVASYPLRKQHAVPKKIWGWPPTPFFHTSRFPSPSR